MPETQHKQPPGTSLIVIPDSADKIAPSMPTSPNSFTKTAHFSSAGFFFNRSNIAEVLPTPRKPIIMLMAIFFVMIFSFGFKGI